MTIEIKPGQIWKDNDRRFERYIRVKYVTLSGFAAVVETVFWNNPGHFGAWVKKRGYRTSEVSLRRFGRATNDGFTLHEDVL